jgi:hypothetical protein
MRPRLTRFAPPHALGLALYADAGAQGERALLLGSLLPCAGLLAEPRTGNSGQLRLLACHRRGDDLEQSGVELVGAMDIPVPRAIDLRDTHFRFILRLHRGEAEERSSISVFQGDIGYVERRRAGTRKFGSHPRELHALPQGPPAPGGAIGLRRARPNRRKGNPAARSRRRIRGHRRLGTAFFTFWLRWSFRWFDTAVRPHRIPRDIRRRPIRAHRRTRDLAAGRCNRRGRHAEGQRGRQARHRPSASPPSPEHTLTITPKQRTVMFLPKQTGRPGGRPAGSCSGGNVGNPAGVRLGSPTPRAAGGRTARPRRCGCESPPPPAARRSCRRRPRPYGRA